MRILIRQGEGPAASITRIHQERADQRANLEQIIRQVIDNAPELHSRIRSIATAPGDQRKLRGIPAIGRGVTGAIPGTKPGDRLSL